ncbi:LOW QUALITY PROTEIN: LRR receptor-like serine/threonine-protein kinase FLS2 [Arabidopsis lyrata subsp. lyrata]|uniref:LOW QUALITY PROTEIN: LRR receptor-like serine/threonine-protein kinase FLS2 n=1 Tax=Arabidopsis lyrata subsp. lyrata TaxID=81972 RepID=UPI000A29B1EA|nr:LOW QUALITY PROTEIN: LRR receptor-like serine/threonine-protein kinase FLS2 [Arabidopsis lyrata subsp. lyrata]|eukprot:XP_020890616.1 LOW QUALITY PROTEIN: LRR receptor-like serine/threonine-protein kinase FLS2 [Arabidopsis lyrata subsp. lyrata]
MEGKVFLGQYLIWVLILMGQLHGYKSCIQKERNALLKLKKYIISISEEGDFNFFFNTWTNDTKSDCCRWEGVECNRTSRRVIRLSTGKSSVVEDSQLNLSLLHPFEEVRSLDLSGDGAYGFSALFDDVEGYKSLKRFRNLEILDLSSNKFNNSIFPFLNAATSLTTLFLKSNNMDGSFPVKELRDLMNLELLDLSGNRFNGSIPVQELTSLRKLKALDLSGNEFSGSMELQGICKLKNIQELDLSQNKLVGQVPSCLNSLTGLRVLDLSSNQLTGKVPSALGSLKSLEYLSLFDNDFEGQFSFGSLANLSKLKVLKLCSKSNTLQLVSESSWKPKFQLRVLALRSCNLEKVPHFLLHQKDLRHLDLSDNIISGTFPSWVLANNTKLVVLLLQNNSLTSFQLPTSAHNLLSLNLSVNKFNHLFPENIGWILPHLQYMNLAMNCFQGNLPSSLGNMKNIQYLDISHNSFYGKLPRSFVKGCYSLEYLKLSHNKLSGEIFPESANFSRISVLSMDNNLFTGKARQGLRSLTSLSMLDISNNNLTGVIPSWIGKLSSLSALLISNNLLEGEIPVSLFSISSLRQLDLSANSLSGDIPPHVNSTDGLVLLLQDNNLSGVIPHTLLANVKILDLRNNRLSGYIPEFINTWNISILLLRGNYLTGRIPRQLCGLSNIQILDLGNNRLNGSIPSCLSNTSFGLGKEDTSYDYDYEIFSSFVDSLHVDLYFESLLMLERFGMDYEAGAQTKVKFATKHRYDAYMGGNLKLLFGIDLSENELSGEIPVELGGLMELQALNLSHNYFSGVIPKSFSGLKNVESLDLSFNRLHGRIPPQLTDLSSLAVFNVSYNNLSGVIPEGRQFNTFDTQSYLGNPLLCGKPTNTSCDNNNFQEAGNEVEADESLIDMVSFYWSFAAAYVTILLGMLASLSFDSPWSRAWFYIVDAFVHRKVLLSMVCY